MARKVREEACDKCKKRLEGRIQVYPATGGILCEECNWKEGDKED